MPAVKEDQVENTTIRDFVQIFTTVQRKIKKREIVYLQNLWDLSFIQMLKGKRMNAMLSWFVFLKCSFVVRLIGKQYPPPYFVNQKNF